MNVKPGDMAKVLGLPEDGGGTIVEVLEPATADEIYRIGLCCGHHATLVHGPWWSVRVFSGTSSWDAETGTKSYLMPGDFATVRDAKLRRIDPEADDTVEDTAERLPAPHEAVPA